MIINKERTRYGNPKIIILLFAKKKKNLFKIEYENKQGLDIFLEGDRLVELIELF